MAFSQAQIDAIKTAIASGTTSVSYLGRTVNYRTLAEMKEILKTMESEVSPGSITPRRTSYATFRRD